MMKLSKTAKMRVSLSLLVLGAITIILLSTGTISLIQNQFNDTTTEKTLGGNGTWTQTYYVKLLKAGTVTSATMNISGIFNGSINSGFDTSTIVNLTSTSSWADINMVTDGKGNLYAVACQERTTGNSVYYFTKSNTSSTWTTERVVSTGAGGYCDIVIDNASNPHIAYYDELNGNMRYANRSGGTWSSKLVDTQVNAYSGNKFSMAIDSNNLIGIGYIWDTGIPDTKIKYITFNLTSNTWSSSEDVDVADVSKRYISLAFDSLNIPHLIWRTGGATDYIYYANRTGGSWHTVQLFSPNTATNEGHLTSLAIDTNNRPHLSALGIGEYVYYYNNTGTAWSGKSIYQYFAGYYGKDVDIKINPTTNYPLISFTGEDPSNAFNFIYWNGSRWLNTTFDTSSAAMTNNYVAQVLQQQMVHILYGNSSTIKYITNGRYPLNVTIDVGNNGVAEFNHSGSLTTMNLTADMSAAFNSYLASCTLTDTKNCTIPINVTGSYGAVRLFNINITYSVPSPGVNITYPYNGQTFSTNISLPLNYTLNDTGVGISTCWFNLDAGTNVTIANCLNTTFNTTEGSHTLWFFVNDTLGNVTNVTRNFVVALGPPVITLNFPGNATYWKNGTNFPLNWTATDANGIGTCQVWHNINGTFSLNKTILGVNTGLMNYTQYNITDGTYIWNVWCNDSLSNGNFSQYNYTFTIDETLPRINTVDITTTAGSQNVIFNVTNYTETNCNDTWFSVYNALGAIDGSLQDCSESSISCNVKTTCFAYNATFTVSGYGNFVLQTYMRDKAGNINSTNTTFTTVAGGGTVIIVTGGGGTATVTTLEPATNFSLTTTGGGNLLDVVLAKDSVRPRTKDMLLINRGIEPLTVQLVCDTTLLNASLTPDIDICQYVTLPNSTVILTPNEVENTYIPISIQVPKNATFGDVYNFNILALQITGSSAKYSKLSVQARVPIWGEVYKYSFIPAQDVTLSEEAKSAYPVILISIFLGFSMFTLFFLLLRRKLPLTAFFFGAFIGIVIAVITLFLL